jgi:hypothetical protein
LDNWPTQQNAAHPRSHLIEPPDRTIYKSIVYITTYGRGVISSGRGRFFIRTNATVQPSCKSYDPPSIA